MAPDLMTLFTGGDLPKKKRLAADDIVSLSYGIKKRSGEQFAKATLNDGTSYIRSLSKSGVDSQTMIKIPEYSSREERDEIVMDLLEKYVQDDVADMMGISQSTVHNIKKKHKKK